MRREASRSSPTNDSVLSESGEQLTTPKIIMGENLTVGTTRRDHVDVDLASILRLKGSRTVSVCLPCRNEEASVGRVVESLLPDGDARNLIDELIVIDDRSTDRSAERALAAQRRPWQRVVDRLQSGAAGQVAVAAFAGAIDGNVAVTVAIEIAYRREISIEAETDRRKAREQVPIEPCAIDAHHRQH